MYQLIETTEEGGESSAATPTIFRFQVERFHFIAYLLFWGICIFAMIYSTFTVVPNLGPCPLSEGDENRMIVCQLAG